MESTDQVVRVPLFSGPVARWLFPAVLLLGSAAATFALATPAEYRGLIGLAFYTTISHFFVSPFPHEPILLMVARDHGAWACAFASTWGALVSALLDYKLTLPLLHRPGVRAKYVNTGIYRWSSRWFGRAPFVTLVVAGLTPIPFYPFKFLALAWGYPKSWYLISLVIGRTPRYWMLAYLGYVLQLPNWSLVLLALALLVAAYFGSRSNSEGSGDARAPAAESVGAAGGDA